LFVGLLFCQQVCFDGQFFCMMQHFVNAAPCFDGSGNRQFVIAFQEKPARQISAIVGAELLFHVRNFAQRRFDNTLLWCCVWIFSLQIRSKPLPQLFCAFHILQTDRQSVHVSHFLKSWIQPDYRLEVNDVLQQRIFFDPAV